MTFLQSIWKGKWIENQTVLMAAALMLTLFSLFPCFQNDWVTWDDPTYVLQNGVIRDFSWSGIKSMFNPANKVLDTYTPLTLVSLAIDYASHQNDAVAYHSTNVLLHLVNVLLVFLLIFKLTGKNLLAFFIAVVFGIHPMHVESVAWVTERKDLLFSFFFLSSCIQYLSYIRHSSKKKSLAFISYGFAIIFGILAMLAKPQAVSLPLVLILLHYWEGKQFKLVDLISTFPFFILSLLTGLLAINIMDENEVGYSFFEQILLSGQACWIYLIKAIFPYNLQHYIKVPASGEIPQWYYLSSSLSLILLGIGLWFGRNNRKIIFGIGFFCVCLIFSLHLFKINSGLAYERFTYLPYIGLYLAFVGFFELISNKTRTNKKISYTVAGLLIISFAFLTFQRSKVWKNDETFWTGSIEERPNEPMGWCKRARYYTSIGQYDKALKDQQKCLELSLTKAKPLVNRGNIFMQTGETVAALDDYTKAIKEQPDFGLPYGCRGILLAQMGEISKGIKDLERAVELDSKLSTNRLNLGLAHELNRSYDIALKHYSKAIEINQYDFYAWKYRGSLSMLLGNYSQAISDLNMAVSLKANFKEAWYQLSKANYQIGEIEKAKKQLEMAIELGAQVDAGYKTKLNY
jgi:tetratricopeptide (TPR) repeat protein